MIRSVSSVFALCSLLVAAQCNPPPKPPPVVPVEVAGAGPVAIGGSGPVSSAGASGAGDAGEGGQPDKPPPPPLTDPVDIACANLAEAGCPEAGPLCVVVLRKAITARLTVVPVVCLDSAHTKAAVRLCGKFVGCK